MADDEMDAVFLALAHPDRRKILDIVRNNDGCCLNDLSAHFSTSRIAVIKHLRVLEEADLIVSRREGRFRRLYFNAVPIQIIHDRWTSEYSALWASQLTRLKYKIESKATPGPSTRLTKGRSHHD